MEGVGGDIKKREETFQIYAENYPDRLVERVIPELRGKEKKRVKGIMQKISVKQEKPSRVFSFTAREKGRVVYTSKEYVLIKGKQQVRYRNRKGRFASVKHKK